MTRTSEMARTSAPSVSLNILTKMRIQCPWWIFAPPKQKAVLGDSAQECCRGGKPNTRHTHIPRTSRSGLQNQPFQKYCGSFPSEDDKLPRTCSYALIYKKKRLSKTRLRRQANVHVTIAFSPLENA